MIHANPIPTIFAALFILCTTPACAELALGQGIMAGEVTTNSVLIETRLTQGNTLIDGDFFDDQDALRDGDLPGVDGPVRLVLSTHPDFPRGDETQSTHLIRAAPQNDHIVRHRFTDLQPNTTYYYRASFGPNRESIRPDPAGLVGTFTTLPGEDIATTTRFHIVTGMNYDKFYRSDRSGYHGEDRDLGYPACEAMLALDADFLVFTGDDVYYDKLPYTQTLEDMRAKWHRQFSQPRMIELLASTPAYWEKDDHDFRFNDSDRTGDRFPPSDLGIATFREQVPIVEQNDLQSPTYRTHRMSKDLQIWLLEGRDYRSPNTQADDADKTLWGFEQRDWLMRTLLESDATFKIIISPTPMLGPDGAGKRDNHANLGGFQTERDTFVAWATEEGLWDTGLHIVCGDRHWQYHSAHQSGAQEFSCGAICDANSRLGVAPGSASGTDPDEQITQPYRQDPASGGFLSVVIEPGKSDAEQATIDFEFYDERGELLYRYDE